MITSKEIDDIGITISKEAEGWVLGSTSSNSITRKTAIEIVEKVIRSKVSALADAERERVRLWNENRYLRGTIDVEKAATDSMRRERDELLQSVRELVDYYGGIEDPELFQEEARRLSNARAVIAKAEGRS